LILDRALRLAVEPLANRADLDIEELLVAVIRVVREDAYRAGSLMVKNLSGSVTVLPGETASIDLEFTLQETLPANSRYRGRMPIMTRDMEIIVVSSGEPLGSEPAVMTTEGAAKPVKKPTTKSKKTTK
jgi:hypothetical protein